jgi:hypothetical protein
MAMDESLTSLAAPFPDQASPARGTDLAANLAENERKSKEYQTGLANFASALGGSFKSLTPGGKGQTYTLTATGA